METPQPTKRPNAAGLVVLGLFGGLLVLAVALAIWSQSPETTAREATAASACADSISRVQQYRAPGQRATVEQEVTTRLLTGTRPAQLGGWSAQPGTANRCYVWLRATVGNEVQQYQWVYDRSTGRVEAGDEGARRLSGW